MLKKYNQQEVHRKTPKTKLYFEPLDIALAAEFYHDDVTCSDSDWRYQKLKSVLRVPRKGFSGLFILLTLRVVLVA